VILVADSEQTVRGRSSRRLQATTFRLSRCWFDGRDEQGGLTQWLRYLGSLASSVVVVSAVLRVGCGLG
jgi:hypothetical protein